MIMLNGVKSFDRARSRPYGPCTHASTKRVCVSEKAKAWGAEERVGMSTYAGDAEAAALDVGREGHVVEAENATWSG